MKGGSLQTSGERRLWRASAALSRGNRGGEFLLRRNCKIYQVVGGGSGGIRTHDAVPRTPVFKTGAFNHSATLPRQRQPGPGARADSAVASRHILRRSDVNEKNTGGTTRSSYQASTFTKQADLGQTLGQIHGKQFLFINFVAYFITFKTGALGHSATPPTKAT